MMGVMAEIAVVDDEAGIRSLIRAALEREGYAVRDYANGVDAWREFERASPDLAILDIMMPRMDGLELCRRMRERGAFPPVIFLSSRDEEIDRVLGLDVGADDYVCKPFGMAELLARVRAALRRAPKLAAAARPAEAGQLAAERMTGEGHGASGEGILALDEEAWAASYGGAELGLTVTEFRMLLAMAARPGCVKTRSQLMKAAFPEDSFPSERAADSHIKRLRAKLSAAGAPPELIESIYGLGYRYGGREGTIRLAPSSAS
jgi:DNA-binding response OmpR family regulator